MKREKFYQVIGEIDDELILQAAQEMERRPKRRRIIKMVWAAACICLLAAALVFAWAQDRMYIQEMELPIRAKISPEKTCTMHMMEETELLEYYGLKAFPQQLGGMERLEQGSYAVYRDAETVVYDKNVLYYGAQDGEQSLSITLAKAAAEAVERKDVRLSKLQGTRVLLAQTQHAERTVYWAEWEQNGTWIHVEGHGMDLREWIANLRKLIRSQK